MALCGSPCNFVGARRFPWPSTLRLKESVFDVPLTRRLLKGFHDNCACESSHQWTLPVTSEEKTPLPLLNLVKLAPCTPVFQTFSRDKHARDLLAIIYPERQGALRNHGICGKSATVILGLQPVYNPPGYNDVQNETCTSPMRVSL